MDDRQVQLGLDSLRMFRYGFSEKAVILSEIVLGNPKFAIWSGSSKKTQHHYGKHGLLNHTGEVITLCMLNSKMMFPGKIDSERLFLASLFHDYGKIWDYQPIDSSMNEWEASPHKRNVHHISRSAIEWTMAKELNDYRDDDDEVLNAILGHHGLREWGSPVAPNSRLAWMLHLCDNMSARMDDCNKWDVVVDKKG